LAVNGVPTNNNPAKIINLSLGSGTCTTAEQQVVSELVSLGVSVVVAAGNNSSAPAAPADCKGVIAVGGNSRDGSKLRYSSYGTYTTLMAPG
ncbi:S8 family serine peptidase, partial [Acinetobacter baumannii]